MKLMREARIVMPYLAEGGPDSLTHRVLRKALVERFGGVTRTYGTGSWMDGSTLIHDKVVVYDVAMADTPDNRAYLVNTAVAAGKGLDQKAVYVRLPSGEVQIVDIREPAPEPDQKTEEPAAPRVKPSECAVGEIWRTHGGAIVAIIRNGSTPRTALLPQRLCFDAVLLDKKSMSIGANAGIVVTYNADGMCALGNAWTLKERITTFD